MTAIFSLLALSLLNLQATGDERDTFPPITGDSPPQSWQALWEGFDPRAEPLEVETLKEWEEDDVVLRIVRFRIGVFKGVPARLAAVYGFPKGGSDLPGLLQIHGGGQYADHKACLMNAKRGYATVSIAWAGRISAPEHRVSPAEVKLFWDKQTDDASYRLTTDWGAVDGYHAPGRNPKNSFPSAKAAAWTLDGVESPRNSGWFLCTVAARRALTFLEHQPEVDADRLGVYGHSMGGKLTVLTAPDSRVKAAAPSCGGISDRDNDSPLFRATLGDDVSLKRITCPVFFLSPANDFHGRIGDLPKAVDEIQSSDWRVTCSPHHNHQDTAAYEVATLLWFDQHLRGTFRLPKTPATRLALDSDSGIPTLRVEPDNSKPIASIDIFYTQHGKPNETSRDRENTVHRFWHHASPTQQANGSWIAELPISNAEQPLWAFANVTYALAMPVRGAGYYYRTYSAEVFNLSSLLEIATPQDLRSAKVRATLRPTTLIEDFQGDWEKEWFSYKPDQWPRKTNKLFDASYRAPDGALLALQVQATDTNKLVVLLDEYAAEIELIGGEGWQQVILAPSDFVDFEGETLSDWSNLKQLTLSGAERLTPPRGDSSPARIIGGNWNGPPPRFRNLRWQEDASEE